MAAKRSDGLLADFALERLCRAYWPPLYAFIRREGYDAHEAQDLTQEFLSRFVQKEWLGFLQDQRGTFRSFLLTFLKHFLAEQRVRACAQKRGGGQPLLSLDNCEAEEREALGSVDGLPADQLYDRRWARAVMDEAARRLREEYAARGRTALFEVLKELQPGEHGESSYAEIGATLGLTEQAVKNAVHSFRRRFGEVLREAIAHTVDGPGEVESELQYLKKVFAG